MRQRLLQVTWVPACGSRRAVVFVTLLHLWVLGRSRVPTAQRVGEVRGGGVLGFASFVRAQARTNAGGCRSGAETHTAALAGDAGDVGDASAGWSLGLWSVNKKH